MQNLFDHFQKNALSITRRVFGYDAIWIRSTGGQVAGRVLLKEPTEAYDVNGVAFSPFHSIMEWHEGTFEGLFELARGKKNEQVQVNGRMYYVRTPYADYDGKVFRVIVERQL